MGVSLTSVFFAQCQKRNRHAMFVIYCFCQVLTVCPVLYIMCVYRTQIGKYINNSLYLARKYVRDKYRERTYDVYGLILTFEVYI